MVVETKSISRKRCLFLCSWVLVLLCSCALFGAEQSHIKTVGVGVIPARYRVFSLRHISAERGSKFLAEAGIGTVSQLPNTNTLLVTAQPAELVKATAILKLVDSNETFVMKAIFPASEAGNLPSNEQIAAELGDISVGTFSEPPGGDAKVKAIIDIHRDIVVAIAPAAEIERIISAANSLLVGSESYLAPGTNSEQRNANGELFGKLLDSLAEAKKRAAGQAQPRVEKGGVREQEVLPAPAGLPQARVTEPESSAVSERAEETFVPELKRPQKSGLPAVAEGPEAKIAVEKLKSEPKPEPASALRSYEPEPIADGNEMLELDLPEKLEIGDLLRLVGEYLYLDYMYDPDKIKGAVTLKLRGPIKVKGLYPLLESVLKFRGFVMTRKGNLVTIVPKAEALEIDPVLYTDVERAELGDVIITRIFKLKHIDTASAQNLLTGMKLGADIRPIPGTRTLIVTGYAYRMARIEEVLEMTDKPGEPKHFRFRQLKYTMAKTLAPKVKTLAEQLGTVSITIAAAPAAAAARLTRKPGESSAAFRRRQEAAKKAAAARAPAAPTARPTVYLEADERTNRILMIGLQEQLTVVDELIDTLDVEQQDLRALRLYEIQHVGAEEVAEKLQELGIIGGGRTTTSRAPAAKSAKPATPTTTTTKERLAGEPQVVIISSTNSLLVNATAEQHIRIAQIIGYVDCEPEQAAINYIVYPLENQDPEDLAGILNKLILETVERQDKEGKITRTTRKKTEEDITIIPDPKTYSLIVYANKRNQQWISSLIKQLDEYRPQVLLDVTLVEISKNDEFNFDLNLISSLPDILGENYSGFADVLIHPDDEGGGGKYSSDIIKSLRQSGRDRFIDIQSMSGAGTAFYGDRHINVLLKAMQTKGYGRVLARPKLLVNDNEQGTIKSQEITYITRTKVSYRRGIDDEGDNVSIPVIDTTFEPYEAGIQLDIEPHISKGDQLRLKITMTRTDFRDTATSLRELNPTPPDKVTSDVTTVVTVPDNTTIILGGLERLSQSKGGTKVPLLGDIPLVGGLFRSTANTDSQSRLYVFVKAYILRPGEELPGESDIEIVSAKNRATFEKYEEEMQKYEDWPGIKPEPMDPLRILEAD